MKKESSTQSDHWTRRRPCQAFQRPHATSDGVGRSPAKIALHPDALLRLAAVGVLGQAKNPGLPPHIVAAAHLAVIDHSHSAYPDQAFPSRPRSSEGAREKFWFHHRHNGRERWQVSKFQHPRAPAVGTRTRKESAMQTYKSRPGKSLLSSWAKRGCCAGDRLTQASAPYISSEITRFSPMREL